MATVLTDKIKSLSGSEVEIEFYTRGAFVSTGYRASFKATSAFGGAPDGSYVEFDLATLTSESMTGEIILERVWVDTMSSGSVVPVTAGAATTIGVSIGFAAATDNYISNKGNLAGAGYGYHGTLATDLELPVGTILPLPQGSSKSIFMRLHLNNGASYSDISAGTITLNVLYRRTK